MSSLQGTACRNTELQQYHQHPCQNVLVISSLHKLFAAMLGHVRSGLNRAEG